MPGTARRRHRPTRGPARLGAEREIAVARLGAQGDGIGDLDGTQVYVPGSLPGERVRVRLGRVRGAGVDGDLLEILQPAPVRVAPPCRFADACGGCRLQHLDDDAYAAWKRSLVVDAVRRAGLDPEAAEHAVAPLERTPPGGRRRATLSAWKHGAETRLGYRARRSHRVVAVADCLLLTPVLNALLPALETLFGDILAAGGAAGATATETESGVDLVLHLPGEPDLARREQLAAFARHADLARLSWQTSPDSRPDPIAERRRPVLCFGDVPVVPPPGGFLQPSAAGEAALVRAARAAAGEHGPIADLYAGCGTFALPLSSAAPVHAVEADADALAALDAAARAAGRRVACERRDLAKRPLRVDELDRFRAVLFDPPRAGARAQSATLAQSAVPRVVAVSCNPATWARDARTLIAGGYRLERVVPIDQFPWSHHVELVAAFRR